MTAKYQRPYEAELNRHAAHWMPQMGTKVLVISASVALQGEVARVSAAAAVELVATETIEQAARQWHEVAAVLVGSDINSPLPGWKGPTILVGTAQDAARMWAYAAESEVDRVAVLPESGQWLAGYLTRLRDPSRGGHVVGLVGACGGAGSSTAALLLAARAAHRGIPVVVIDADPVGGGLETLVAAEQLPGLRWPDLLNASGAINPEQLRASLTHIDGIDLLSWRSQLLASEEPGRASFALTHEVVRAAREAFELVILDLGRDLQMLREVGSECDQFLMPVHGRLGCVAAGKAIAALLPAAPIALLLRLPLREGIDAQTVANTAGLPCFGAISTERGIEEHLENGRLQEAAGSRKMRRLLDGLINDIVSNAGFPEADGNTSRRRTSRASPIRIRRMDKQHRNLATDAQAAPMVEKPQTDSELGPRARLRSVP